MGKRLYTRTIQVSSRPGIDQCHREYRIHRSLVSSQKVVDHSDTYPFIYSHWSSAEWGPLLWVCLSTRLCYSAFIHLCRFRVFT